VIALPKSLKSLMLIVVLTALAASSYASWRRLAWFKERASYHELNFVMDRHNYKMFSQDLSTRPAGHVSAEERSVCAQLAAKVEYERRMRDYYRARIWTWHAFGSGATHLHPRSGIDP